MDRTDNYSTEYQNAEYYRRLVDLRMEANKLLTELQFDQDRDTQRRFKKVLSFLAKEMEPKYQRRTDMEKPKILERDAELDMSKVEVNQCAELLEDFRDLQEKLGITSMARNEYELDEKGAVKKEK